MVTRVRHVCVGMLGIIGNGFVEGSIKQLTDDLLIADQLWRNREIGLRTVDSEGYWGVGVRDAVPDNAVGG